MIKFSNDYVPEDCWACANENARQEFRDTGKRRVSFFMYLCPECGDKRCAKAADHLNECDKGEGERAMQKMRNDIQAARDAKIWDEGFDAGEKDVMGHETWEEPCIQNPYRREEQR